MKLEDLYDVAIVGAGFAGLSLAHALKNKGLKIVLIDRLEKCPDVFRAEKIEPDQADIMRTLGIFEMRRPNANKIGEILNFRSGDVYAHDTKDQYGISYSETVNNLRKELPDSVTVLKNTVTHIEAYEDERKVHFLKGGSLTSKVVVMSTGCNNKLLSSLGVIRKVDKTMRSLTIGFDIKTKNGKEFNFNGFNYFLEFNDICVYYITIFPIGNRMRVNLFTCLKPKDQIVKELRNDTVDTVHRIFPKIYDYIGEIEVASTVQIVPTEFYRLKNTAVDGVVIIGDEYQGVNPATGSGLSKVLMDALVLGDKYIPKWIKQNDFSKKNIKIFYADQEKQSADKRSMDYWFYADKSIKQKSNGVIGKAKRFLMSHGLL